MLQKQAKQLVAQHKTQVPRQNRLGLPVGAAGSAPQDDPQVTVASLAIPVTPDSGSRNTQH